MFCRYRQKKIKSFIAGLLTLAAALGLLLFSSCHTIPEIRNAAVFASRLPPDAGLYFSVTVPQNRELLSRIFEAAMPEIDAFDQVLVRTKAVYASVGTGFSASETKTGKTQLDMVAVGRYPANLIRTLLSSDPEWEEEIITVEGDLYPVLKHRGRSLSLVSSGSNVIYISSGDVSLLLLRELYQQNTEFPEAIAQKFLQEDLFLYAPEPGREALGEISEGKIRLPVRNITVSLNSETEELYRLSGTVLVEEEKDTRILTVLLRGILASLLMQEKIMTLDEIKTVLRITSDGAAVFVNGLVFTREDIAALAAKIFSSIVVPGGE